MGYDVTFQLVDERRVRDELIPALVTPGAPPPASPFDELDDAREIWDEARAAALTGNPKAAALAACQLVVQWSQESLPFAWTRSFALTYAPLRVEEGLSSPPPAGLGSPRALFGALEEKRPKLARWFPRRLEGNYSTGGYASRPDAWAVRRFYASRPSDLRSRVTPVLAVFRAAERHGLAVIEATDLFRSLTPPQPELLAWPGLERFGLDGPPLSADEWGRALDAHAAYTKGDREDICDRAAEIDPDDGAELLGRVVRAFDLDPGTFDERREQGLARGPEEEAQLEAAIQNVIAQPRLVYLGHGLMENLGVEILTMLDREIRVLNLEAVDGSGRVRVPLDTDGTPGLIGRMRPPISKDEAAAILATLKERGGAFGERLERMTWNRRYAAAQLALKEGTPREIAEVIAYLASATRTKTLSIGECSIQARARRLLATELAFALEVPAAQVEALLDAALSAG